MKKTFFTFLLFFLTFLFFDGPVKAKDKDLKVKSSAQFFTYQGDNYLALLYQNKKNWHTYWKNPGDAGLPIATQFFLEGEEVFLDTLEWPAPMKFFEKGGLISYGYSGQYAIFYPLGQKVLGEIWQKKLTIKSKWLVCYKICIPEEDSIAGVIQDKKFHFNGRKRFSWPNEKLIDLIEKLPMPSYSPDHLKLFLSSSEKKNKLILHYETSLFKKENTSKVYLSRNLLTPFPQDKFTFRKEELFTDQRGQIFGRMEVDWDGEFLDFPQKLPADGQFEVPEKFRFIFYDYTRDKASVVERAIPSFTAYNREIIQNYYNDLTKLRSKEQKVFSSTTGTTEIKEYNIFFYLLLAFLGGIILNFMPCVLPVISLKLFGLIRKKGQIRKIILKHNLFYTLGILASFIILATVLVSFKVAGEYVGWGFQLQSPQFVSVMMVILFVFALNLFGLFEFSTPGGKFFGNVNLDKGILGDFLTGVFATVLSTPCSAPFLGTALTFAFTSSIGVIYSIFLMIGLGLAFPFIVTGVFPFLISFLPKPGVWMDNLRKFLGLTLILTIIWLYDVFVNLISDYSKLILLNAVFAFTFFAIYFSIKISKTIFWRFLFFSLPFALMLFFLVGDFEKKGDSYQIDLRGFDSKEVGLDWEVWTPDKLLERKRIVFMDFTAKWCIACVLNKKLVLNTNNFSNLQKQYDIRLLRADWTKRDPIIGLWLKKHGYVGVPAYFIQDKNGKIYSLGEVLTIKEIKTILEKL